MNRKAPPVRVVFSFEERKNVTGFFEVLIRVERRSKKEGKKREAKRGKTSYSNLGDIGSLSREPILFFAYLIYYGLIYFSKLIVDHDRHHSFNIKRKRVSNYST